MSAQSGFAPAVAAGSLGLKVPLWAFCAGDWARTAGTARSGDRLDIPAQSLPRAQSWLCGVQLQKQGLLLVVSVEE